MRYAKTEEASAIIGSLETYIFAIEGPAKPAAAVSEAESEPADPGSAEEPGAAVKIETTAPAPAEDGRSSSLAGDAPVSPETEVPGEKLN